MHNIVYWVPDDRVGSQQQLVYLLGHESREAAKESFAGFVVPSDEFNFIGFRIAAVPEPASLGLAARAASPPSGGRCCADGGGADVRRSPSRGGQPSSSRSAKSFNRPAARFAVRMSSRPSTGASTSPNVTITRLGHAAAKSSPVTLVMMSIRLGGTPI